MRHATRTLNVGASLLALAALAPAALAAPQQARPAAEARAGQEAARDAAREFYQRENAQLRRRARIERLIQIYSDRGDGERVRSLQALREREELAHRAALARLEQRLGTARFDSLRSTRRAEIAQRLRRVQVERERAAADARMASARAPEARRGEMRVVERPAPRPRPRPDRPRR